MHDNLIQGISINSIINPDSVFKINCSYVSSISDDYASFGETVHLKLYEKNNLLIDTFFIGPDFISSKFTFPCLPYKIELTTTEYSVSSSDSIPSLVPIEDAYLIFPAGLDSYGDYLAEANITFTDPPGHPNYYEIIIYSGTDSKNYWQWNGDIEITEPAILNEGIIDYLPSSLFFSDELFNGKTYTVRVKGYGGYYSPGDGFICSSKTFVILRSISEAYYNYRKSYTRHVYSQQLQGDFMDLIFKGEPQNMYTNIHNGYGIFAGYQESIRRLYHKE